MSSTNIHEVIIIGSGPAGLTAAIYTARANLAPLVIEGEPSSTSDQPGGQLMLTTDVENYPGFPEGVMGPELMLKFREQAARFNTTFITEKVTKVDFSARPFKVWVRDEMHQAKSVIVSTGAQSLMLGLENEKGFHRVRLVTVSFSRAKKSSSLAVATRQSKKPLF
jgi:thioredoxin reductase (NADPH)